jgi:hypothetical protein
MGISAGPSGVSDGLVFQLDAANLRSYSGSGLTSNGLVGGIGGTLVNGVGFSSANNGSFIFDGTNDYINVPSLTSISGDFTVTLWFKPSSSNGIVARLIEFDYINGFWLGRSITTPSYWGGGIRETSGDYGIFLPFADNEWHYLVSVRSSTTHYIYRDGIANFTLNTVSSNVLTSNGLLIGFSGGGFYFNGNISQVQIFNRALSATEIQQNFNAMRERYNI